MHFCTPFFALCAVLSAVSAAIFNVTVGKNNQLTYDPPFLTGVQNGDIIGFRFVSQIHSVTESTFDQPCTEKAGGIDSGIISAANFPEWSTVISDASAPLWFHCIPHCSLGMVFAINPTGNTFNAFIAAAKTSTLSSGVTTPSTPSSAPSSVSTAPGAVNSPATTSSISTMSTNASGALGQLSAEKVALWFSIVGVVVLTL